MSRALNESRHSKPADPLPRSTQQADPYEYADYDWITERIYEDIDDDIEEQLVRTDIYEPPSQKLLDQPSARYQPRDSDDEEEPDEFVPSDPWVSEVVRRVESRMAMSG